MSDIIAFDTEVFYSTKLKYSLKNQLPEHFCKSHLFDCYMVSASDGETEWAGHPRDFNWDTFEGKTIVSHNAAWDMACYEEMVRRGIAKRVPYKEWVCSANLTAYICNRRALAQAVEHLYAVKLSKAARDDSQGKHWPADFTPEQQTTMLAYARSDAKWCWKLWADFSPKWPEHEKRLSQLTIAQARKGIQIDTALLDQFIMQTHAAKLLTEKLLPWIAGAQDESWDDFNTVPTSTKCIAEECRRHGIPCPPVKSREGEEAFEEWEATYADKHPWIPALSSWRSVNKLLGTFVTMKERIRPDGTMPFGQKYFASHTGRVGGDAKVNLFNQRKQALLLRQDGLMETTQEKIDTAHKEKKKTGAWPAWVLHAVDFRNLIIARPNRKLIASDLSQIEPRVAAFLVGDKKFLELVSKGFSPYHAHAITTMGWAGGDLKEEDPGLYSLAKCLASGTLVLTPGGYVPIEKIKLYDKVWDGVSWVSHSGAVYKGLKKVIKVGYEYFTEDHGIYFGEEARAARDVSAGAIAAQLERRVSPRSDWHDLWQLGCAVALAGAEIGILACRLSLPRLWKKFRGVFS